jgi:ribosomal protein S1
VLLNLSLWSFAVSRKVAGLCRQHKGVRVSKEHTPAHMQLICLQAMRMCRERKETVRVAFQELNDGGLMARFLGLRLFMPLSHLSRPEPGKFMNHEVSSSLLYLRASTRACRAERGQQQDAAGSCTESLSGSVHTVRFT